MGKRLRQAAGAVRQLPRSVRWSAAAVAVGAFMLWLVLYAPSLFVPTPSDAELRQVDAATRLKRRWGSGGPGGGAGRAAGGPAGGVLVEPLLDLRRACPGSSC